MASKALVKASALIKLLLTRLGCGYVYGSIGETCTEDLLKRKQAQYGAAMGSGYYQSGGDYSKGLCARWLGRWVADCSGLIKWARKELSGVWRDVSAQGTYDQCAEGQRGKIKTMPLIPGVAVFMYSNTKKRMTHVGLYIGNGYVIEARGVLYGVVRTKLSARAWTHWGQLAWLDYDLPKEGGKAAPGTDADAGDNSTPKPDDLPVLRKGSKGDKVKLLQQLLIAAGYSCGKWGADGEFGSATRKAVKAYQRAHGLKQDGVVGIKTWTELLD